MSYIGDFTQEQIIDFTFNTLKTDGTLCTLDSMSATGIIIINWANETTEQLSTVGSFDLDYDGTTGMHHVQIDTNNVFFTDGNYTVYLNGGTVDGVSTLGYIVSEFSIDNRSNL